MIDLHMHSIYSDDGEFSPAELAELCRKRGIKMMSVTDHNCVRANPEAAESAKKIGVRYISGVEIDCVYDGIGFHMLGYGIDCQSDDFSAIEKNVDCQSRDASFEMLAKTRRLGFDVTREDMEKISSGCLNQYHWTGEMFAEVLLNKSEYREHPLLMPYREGGARSDNPYVNFYWDIYSQGKPCYVKISYPEMKDVVEIIHRNHGSAVLAHPGANLKSDTSRLDGIIRLGIDGIEAYSSYHSSEQTQMYCQAARRAGLFTSCGSDFHGRTKPSVKLGGVPVPDEVQRELDAYIKHKQDC